MVLFIFLVLIIFFPVHLQRRLFYDLIRNYSARSAKIVCQISVNHNGVLRGPRTPCAELSSPRYS